MGKKGLREFEELVLLCVLAAGDDAYGAVIQATLLEEAGRDSGMGAIYTALDRLSQRGLVTSRFGDPTPVRGGRRKRHYTLTPAGLALLAETRRQREALWAKAGPMAMDGRSGE